MGVFDWFKKGVDVEGDELEEEVAQQSTPTSDEEARRKQAFNRLVYGTNTYGTNEIAKPEVEGKKAVKIYMVKTNDDLQEVVDRLKAGEPVIVNLSKVSKGEVQRTQDFLSGVVFVLGAHISTFAPNIFLVSPDNVEITR